MIRFFANRLFAAGAVTVLLAVPQIAFAKATETVLHVFAGGTDGYSPEAGLTLDSAGDLYGTTYYGGINRAGTIFKVAPDGTESKLYDFDNTHGAYPEGQMIIDKSGNLVGTTFSGGNLSDCVPSGCGVVFTMKANGSPKVIYSFTGKNGDGAEAVGGPIQAEGAFYGATFGGGDSNQGAFFAVTKKGTETSLFSFGDMAGADPVSTLVKDKAGNFYGMTEEGGANGHGTVFKLTASGSETVLHSFVFDEIDGMDPFGGLLLDKSGNLYGTTASGGQYDDGVVFRLAPDGTETILHDFTGGSDGRGPSGGLISDGKGNLYGATGQGGTSSNCALGCGTVFRISTGGTFNVMYAFQGGNDGSSPISPLAIDQAENLYGVTYGGGAYDSGTVFKITP